METIATGYDGEVIEDGGNGVHQREAVLLTARDRDRACEVADLRWRVLLYEGAIAEFAVGVVAPGPYGAVAFQRERVIIAGRNGDHTADVACLNGRGSTGIGSIAELAVPVVTPSDNSAVRS